MKTKSVISREYLQLHYWDNKESIHEIAEKLDTYPNRVRRSILEFWPKLRTKAQAQKNALKRGTSVHPTEGRNRTTDEKTKISKSVAKRWENITEDERGRRVKAAQERWAKIPYDIRLDMSKKAAAGVRRAAKEGSYLEKFLLDELRKRGYNILFHEEAIKGSEKMHVDLLVAQSRTCIEIDGPSHFLPIWGEEALQNSISWDNEKNGILLNSGFNVIRVKLLVNTISLRVKREVLEKLLDYIKSFIEKGVKSELIEIEVE
jgi:very-short-patch-repair endonuclease